MSACHLRTYNGNNYLCAEGGGGREVNATRTAAGAWETFDLEIASTGQATLKANNGQYVCAEGGGGGAVNANRAVAGSWESFTLELVSGGSITAGSQVHLRTSNNNYVCAEQGGGGQVDATRTVAAQWETFTLEMPAVAGQSLDDAVNGCGRMPVVVSGSTDLGAPSTTSVDAGGVAYVVTEQRRRLVNDVTQHAFLQDIAAMGVWPGEVIQGAALLNGDVAPIGPLSRQPGTINIVTDIVSNTPGPQSAHVTAPDGATVDQLRRQLLQALKPTDAAGVLLTGFEQASTFCEVGVKLGLSIKGSTFGVDANASLDETHKQSTVVASVRQIFYDVTFTPDGAQASGIWPKASVSSTDLAPFMGSGNPPLYVDSVQYGRFICVTAQGSFSSSELKAALSAQYKAAVTAGVTLDAHSKQVLQSSQVNIYTIGVPGHLLFETMTDPITGLDQVYKSGLAFNPQNPGAPISFTCRHVADGTLAHVGLAAEYLQPLSAAAAPISGRQFQVFDGPGGGLVDTGINVNPGDTVTISASGQIWSGLIFFGTNGPEGWPGHQAPAGAPMPSAPAFCLIHRFSNDPRWIETDRFWQGSPQAGSGGRLLLNENDNNPYNGNPNDRWTVNVDVQRAAAAAVGIYV